MYKCCLFIVVIIIIILFIVLRGDYDKEHDDKIRKLVRQSARWSTAAAQDENSMIAVLHANYGAGYLWALKDIAKNYEIERAAGIDVDRFTSEIINIQDMTTKRMAKLCPEYAPEATYLSQIGGEG